jgi:ADP-heptose:LPS heptosyltransferase
MEFLFNKKLKKIGIAKIGGLGDTIQLLFLSHAIRRKYPEAEITIYARDKNEYLKRDTKVDRIIFTGYCDWNKLIRKEVRKYDLFFDDRYYVGIWKPNNKYGRHMELHTKDINKYWNFFDYLEKLNCNLLEMSAKNSGVKLIEEDFNLDFLIENNKLELISKPYILLYNDDSLLRKTKSYPQYHWNKVISYLKVNYSDLNLIQIGNKKHSKIEKTVDLRNKTNFEELCSLVRGALLIVTTEGLIPHLAKGFNTKSIVLFGPTIKKCFGYKENINIQGDIKCSGCWYSTDDWYKNCPKKYSECKSMSSILPAQIIDSISNIIL